MNKTGGDSCVTIQAKRFGAVGYVEDVALVTDNNSACHVTHSLALKPASQQVFDF